MNVRKNLPLIVGGSIGLILVLAALVLLIVYQSDFGKANSSLKEEQGRLEKLVSRRPFPNLENVDLTNTNLARISEFKDDVLSNYRAGDFDIESIEPAEFPPLLEKVVKGLREKAQASDVLLAENLDFGFSRYIQGELPDQENMDRLVYQVKGMQLLLENLFEANVKQVDSVERSVFEEKRTETVAQAEQPGGRRSRRSRRTEENTPSSPDMNMDENDYAVAVDSGEGLFTKERFELKFQTHESGMWNVLNRMAKLQPFCAVKNVEITGPIPGKVQPAQSAENAPRTGNRLNQGRQREVYEPVVVAGRESLEVSLTVDFYRFPEAEQEGGEL